MKNENILTLEELVRDLKEAVVALAEYNRKIDTAADDNPNLDYLFEAAADCEAEVTMIANELLKLGMTKAEVDAIIASVEENKEIAETAEEEKIMTKKDIINGVKAIAAAMKVAADKRQAREITIAEYNDIRNEKATEYGKLREAAHVAGLNDEQLLAIYRNEEHKLTFEQRLGVEVEGKVHVKNAGQVEHLWPRLKKIAYKGNIIPAVHFQGKGNIVCAAQEFPASYMSQFIDEFVISTELNSAAGMELKDAHKRVFMGLLYVAVEDLQNFLSISYDNLKKGLQRINMTLWTHTDEHGNDKSEWLYSIDWKNGSQMLLDSHETVLNDQLFVDENGKKRPRFEYTGAYGVSSAGAMKKGGMIMPGFWRGEANHPFTKLDWHAIMDRMMCGTFRMQYKYGPKTFTEAELAQFAMRLAQCLAPATISTDKVPLPSYLTVPGKFWLKDKAGNKVEHMDGIYLVLDLYVSTLFNNMSEVCNKYTFTAESVRGVLMQCRPWAVCKGTALATSLKLLELFLKNYADLLPELVVINGDTADEETAREYFIYGSSKGKKGAFGGKAVLVVYPSVIKEYFTDKITGEVLWPTTEICGKKVPFPALINDFNGQKTGFDVRYKTGLRILNAAHCNSDSGITSVQSLQSCVYADFEKTIAMADNKAFKMAAEKLHKVLNVRGRSAMPGDFMLDNINYDQLLGTVAPAYTKIVPAAYKNVASKSLEGLVNLFETCNFEEEAYTNMLIPDLFAIFYRKQVLGNFSKEVNGKVMTDFVEVYTNTVDEGTEAIMIRHPKAGRGEFMKVQVIAKDLLMERVLNDECADEIFEMLDILAPGIISIPSNPLILKGLGGADFDGDKITLITDEDFYNLLADYPSFIVEIE